MSARESRGGLNKLRRLSDEELARAAAHGDEAAARVLLERFEEPLYRYTLARVRDPDLAREATWSALFEAARAVRMDDYSEPVKPWLFRVAHTAADVAGGRPNGDVEDDQAAARAAEAPEEDRDRLQRLLAGIDALPDRERGSLLLRELVGLEYTGIATVTGARASAARQAVFRARLALQENPDPVTEHCDEIRAAMSKAEHDVRERRSIATHLETCAVCEEFARQLETRPDDLRTLFPAPDEPLAAEIVPPLPPVPGAAEREPAGAAVGAGAISPVDDRPDRDRRRALIALALAVLLVGAGIATALALNDNGGGEKGKARASREGSTATQERSTEAEGAAAEKEAAREKAAKEKAAREKAANEKAAREKAAREKAAKEKAAREKAANEKAAKEKAAREKAAREKAAKQREAARAKERAGSAGAAAGGSNAQSGEASESGQAGSANAAGTNGAAGERAAAGQTVPRTGLDVSLLVVLGLLMLATGVSLRRVYADL